VENPTIATTRLIALAPSRRCEQMEDLLKRGRAANNSVVRRRGATVNAGTLTEDTLLDPDQSLPAVRLARSRGSAAATASGLPGFDISTANSSLPTLRLASSPRLAGINPNEVIVTLDALYRRA